MAEATRLITGTSSIALDGHVPFSGEFSVMTGAFALGQVLNFGSLAYIVDCNDELCPLDEASRMGNGLSAPPPPL